MNMVALPFVEGRASSPVQAERSSALFQPRAHRHIFQKARQHWLAALRARPRRSCRSIPVRAVYAARGSPRSRPCGRSAFQAHKPRQSRRPVAELPFPDRPPDAAACRRPLRARPSFTCATRNSTFAKSSMLILPSGIVAAGLAGALGWRSGHWRWLRAAGACAPPETAVVALFCSSIFCILSTADLSARGNTALHLAQLRAEVQLSPLQLRQVEFLDVSQAHLRPDLRRRIRASPDAPAPSQCAAPPRWCRARWPDASGSLHPAFRPAPTVRFRRCTCPPPEPVPRPFRAPAKTGTGRNSAP